MKDFQQDVLSLVILNLNNVDLCFPVQVTKGNVSDFFFFTLRKLCQLSRKSDDHLKSQTHQEHQSCINYQSYTTINLVT